MFSKRAITVMGTLCSLGLASGAGAQSWGDKLKDAAGATAEDVKTGVQQSADQAVGQVQGEADAKAVAAPGAEDVKTEVQEPADTTAEKAGDADVADEPPAVAGDGTNTLQGAATAGAATGVDAVAKGADMGSAAKQGGAAAVNKYLGSTGAGEAAAVPSGAAAEQAGEQEVPKE